MTPDDARRLAEIKAREKLGILNADERWLLSHIDSLTSEVARLTAELDTARDRALEEAVVPINLWLASTQTLRLHMGELSAQELRSVRAALKSRVEAILALRSNPSASPSGAMEWRKVKEKIDNRLNNCLVEMKPDHDDSITGFNEAWDIVRKAFDEIAPPRPNQAGEGEERG